VLGVLIEAATGMQGAAQAANQMSTGVAMGSIASYSREQELQADKLGAEYLSRVGYSPKHMVDVITLLRDQERFAADTARAQGRKPREGNDWLASHPSNDQRLDAIRRLAASEKGAGTRDEGRQRFLQAIDGITFGESREQGVVRGQRFFHEPLGIALTAPAGWSFDNNPDELYIINGPGDAAVVMKAVPANAGKTHEEILRNALKATTGRVDRSPIGGFEATHFVGQRTVQDKQTQPLDATLITGPGGRTFAFLNAGRDAARPRCAKQRRRSALSRRPTAPLPHRGRCAAGRCRPAASPNWRGARRWARRPSGSCG
jgi:predicted Zn-dependent protease